MTCLSSLDALLDADKIGLPAEPGIAPTVSGEGAFGAGDELAAQDAAVHFEDEEIIFVSDDAPFEGVFCEEDFGTTGRASVDLIDGGFECLLRGEIKTDTAGCRNTHEYQRGT